MHEREAAQVSLLRTLARAIPHTDATARAEEGHGGVHADARARDVVDEGVNPVSETHHQRDGGRTARGVRGRELAERGADAVDPAANPPPELRSHLEGVVAPRVHV